MVRFIIVRHGLTDFNRLKKYQGQHESNLEPIGIEQAEATAERVAAEYRLDAIYSSDLSRAVKTAEPFARRFSLPINKDAAFREVDVGEWTLQLIADVEKNYPEDIRSYRSAVGEFRFPGGESFEDTAKRAMDGLMKIAEKHDGETVLVVSHGGTIRAMICSLLGYPIKELSRVKPVGNASITVVEYENGQARFILTGERSHLPEHLK